MAQRLLIIRFSSFGDVVHALASPSAFKQKFPHAEIHWLIRSDLAELIEEHPEISKVHQFPRSLGLLGLIRFSWRLFEMDFSHVYDAHNNLRSGIVRAVFLIRKCLQLQLSPQVIIRPKNRFRRWLFFKWRLRVLPQPFQAVLSYLWPFEDWGIETEIPKTPQIFSSKSAISEAIQKLGPTFLSEGFIALAPSAAWDNKRWPIEHWQKLIELLATDNFALLGGPEDLFCEEIKSAAPARVLNLAGQLDLSGSVAIVGLANSIIANDTGLLQVGDQLGKPTIALIGPTAFGYPTQSSSRVCEVQLTCKPCSKDGHEPCTNKVLKKCMYDITPESVARALQDLRVQFPVRREAKV